jgi:hypothetical protein
MPLGGGQPIEDIVQSSFLYICQGQFFLMSLSSVGIARQAMTHGRAGEQTFRRNSSVMVMPLNVCVVEKINPSVFYNLICCAQTQRA